jgi:DNA-directed RNA polymerase subunit M/transcription elongation factor TFIIS
MPSDTEKKEYISEIRSKGLLALATVMNNSQKINTLEKHIYSKSKNSEDFEQVYKRILYQTVGDLITEIDMKNLVINIKNEKNCWNHSTFSDIKNLIEENDDFIINPFEVEEGVTTCHCGSGRVFTYQKQCRGSDEPMTTFAKCVECKKQWSYSG